VKARRIMSALRKGARRPQDAEGVPGAAAGAQLGEMVLQPLDVGRRVRPQTPPDAGTAPRPRSGGDRGNLSKSVETMTAENTPPRQRRRDRVGDHRMAGQRSDVLAGNTFGAEPRRDERDGRGGHLGIVSGSRLLPQASASSRLPKASRPTRAEAKARSLRLSDLGRGLCKRLKSNTRPGPSCQAPLRASRSPDWRQTAERHVRLCCP
jgi:hypothetical protein